MTDTSEIPPPRRDRARSASPRPFAPDTVSDRETRLRKVEKCLTQLDTDVRSTRSLMRWLLGILVPSIIAAVAYIVIASVTTQARVDGLERSQERQETASSAVRADVRAMQSKVSELATEIRLSRESQRADAEEMKEALIRLEDRLDRRRR